MGHLVFVIRLIPSQPRERQSNTGRILCSALIQKLSGSGLVREPLQLKHSTASTTEESLVCMVRMRIPYQKSGNLTFESLRQTCFEPEERVLIDAQPPQGALPNYTIDSVSVTNASWLPSTKI